MDLDSLVIAYGGREMLIARMVLVVALLLLAVFATKGIRTVLRRAYGRVRRFFPEWLQILCHGFADPILLICRALLLFFAAMALVLDSSWQLHISKLFLAVIAALLGWGFWRSAALCGLLLRSAQNRLDLESNKTLTAFFSKIYRAVVAVFTVIIMLDLYGIPITGLLTGAGIAGLAVSLGAQSTLSNLLAGVMLVLEHPFGIGDYIVLGSFEGTVEEISFRSTRLRTLDNVLISVENSKVSAEYIQNVTNRSNRELKFVVGVTYNTPRAKIEALMQDFEAMLRADTSVCTDRIFVNVTSFSASSIDIELRTYVTQLSLADFTALKGRINLKVMDLMEKNGCSFAFPSTSVYLETTAQ